MLWPPDERARGVAHHRRRRALHEAAHDVLAGRVGRLGERRHQLVGRVERQRRQPRVALAGRVDVEARLVGEDEQRALGRIADDLAVDELRVAGDDVGQDRVVDRVRGAGGVLDLARRARSPSPRSCSGRSGRATSTAVIWFIVSVPVLSELIADVEPERLDRRQVLEDRAVLRRGRRRRATGSPAAPSASPRGSPRSRARPRS